VLINHKSEYPLTMVKTFCFGDIVKSENKKWIEL